MTPTIYSYEIELKVARNGKTELVVRTEHAYSLMDAMHQALIAQQAETGGDISLSRVGPPAEAVRLATTLLGQQVTDTVSALLNRLEHPVKTPKR